MNKACKVFVSFQSFTIYLNSMNLTTRFGVWGGGGGGGRGCPFFRDVASNANEKLVDFNFFAKFDNLSLNNEQM